jgi:hypothetical protein
MSDIDPTFQLACHGIEKSVGSRVDVLAHPYCRYMQTEGNSIAKFKEYDWEGRIQLKITGGDGERLFRSISPNMISNVPKRLLEDWERLGDSLSRTDKVQVFGPYTHELGLELMSQSMFGCSFFRLPREPHNYGDRMEYTQIEMICCGTIPVFDVHYGQNNYDDAGKRYCDTPHWAVWSDRDNLRETAETLVRIADDPVSQECFRLAAQDFVRREFDAFRILPEFFSDMVRLGKDKQKETDAALMERLFGDEDAGRDLERLLDSGEMPAVGFAEIQNKTLKKFKGRDPDHEGVAIGLTGAARIPVKKYEERRSSLEAFF